MTNAIAIISAHSILDQIERQLALDPNISSEHTREGYRRDLLDFEDFRKSDPMSKQLAEEYILMLREEGKSPATINRKLAAIRWWARRVADLAYEDPTLSKGQRDEIATQAARVALVRDTKGERLPPGRMLDPGERKALIEVCFSDRIKDGGRANSGVRDAAILTLGWATGLRISEIRSLELSDIDGNHIIVRNGKGRKDRSVPINAELRRRLREWLSVRGSAPGQLFLAINKANHVRAGHGLSDVALTKMLHKRVRRASLKKLSWHDFRRTFCSELLDRGVDIVTVQQLMGHSSPSTTAMYDRRDEHAKRRAVEQLLTEN